MKIFFTKLSRYLKRKMASVIFFFIRNNFDEFIGGSATLQNMQELQRIISDGVDEDRSKIKEGQIKVREISDDVAKSENTLLVMKVEFEKSSLDVQAKLLSTETKLSKIEKFVNAVNNQMPIEWDAAENVNCEEIQLTKFAGYSSMRLKLRHSLANFPKIDYVAFENKFRGSQELIKKRQSVFLPFFEKCTNVLDIGCGRGEFLELLNEKNIYATGIDIDDGMIEMCREKNLNAIRADVFEFLENLKQDEVNGVFCSQAIEHFSFKEIQWIVYQLGKKLRKDGIVLFETINPRCLPAMQMFYVDMTHVQPVDPETLLFIARGYGFRHNATIFTSPVDVSLDSSTQDGAKMTQYGDYSLIVNKI